MTTVRRALVLVLAAGLLTTACGGDEGDSGTASSDNVPADQTVEVGMVDLAFEPTALTAKSGTTVRFVFRNEGALPHQAYFGDEAVQKNLADGKGKPVGVEVGPGQTKSFVHRFDQPARLLIGCHVPGHYTAGMKARLTVE
ncbi:MAG: cupredoxin domain-containing protein [Acidimicrobiales bacterium]